MAERYHVEPNVRGQRDLSDFKFAAAATAPNAAVDSIGRSTERNMMDRTEVLIVPPPSAQPAGQPPQP